jgi:hypothetical protein
MKITVGELRERLKAFADDDQVMFGSSDEIEFVRAKKRGPKLVQIELRLTIYDEDAKWIVDTSSAW